MTILKYKTSIAYNIAKDLLKGMKTTFMLIGILTTLVMGSLYTNNDEWINSIDDQLPHGIFIIHDYILNTYGPK